MGDIQNVYGGYEFDCNEVEPSKDYEVLPAGWYTAMIDETEIMQTKAMTGYYLKLRFVLLSEEPELKNRKVFTNINLSNPNKQAEEIGMRNLSAIGHAVGVLKINDSAELKDKPMQIKLKVKNDPNYGAQNEISAYKPVEAAANNPAGTSPAPAVPPASQAVSGAGAPPAAPVQAAPPTQGVPPWKR